MVRKTEAVGMDAMKLGAALAILRYNGGSTDTSPASDCCAVCGFSEESGMIGIDVAGLPVSSDEILWVECSKCEQ